MFKYNVAFVNKIDSIALVLSNIVIVLTNADAVLTLSRTFTLLNPSLCILFPVPPSFLSGSNPTPFHVSRVHRTPITLV